MREKCELVDWQASAFRRTLFPRFPLPRVFLPLNFILPLREVFSPPSRLLMVLCISDIFRLSFTNGASLKSLRTR